MTPEQQLFFMKRALELGEKGRITAPPNPWVGCVIVQGEEIVGEGYHEKPGAPHAEKNALEMAGVKAKGATAFVTLEPCVHLGRTSPCTDALLQYGIARVVIPFIDPDPQVSGKGVEKLRKSGIEVEIGVGEQMCMRSLAPYLHHRKTGLPFVHLKIACSLDGRYTAEDGSSKWITGEKARLDVHRLRAQAQAILVGRKTAGKDLPHLTVRHPQFKAHPLRIVLDSRGKLKKEGPLFDPHLGETLVFSAKGSGEKVDLKEMLLALGKRGVLELLVEGGGEVWSSFVREGLAQKLTLYFGGKLLGSGPTIINKIDVETLSKAKSLLLLEVESLGEDLKVSYLFT